MKKLMYFSGAFALSLIPLGLLFRFMHWPAASILLALGTALFSLVFVPSLSAYLYKK